MVSAKVVSAACFSFCRRFLICHPCSDTVRGKPCSPLGDTSWERRLVPPAVIRLEGTRACPSHVTDGIQRSRSWKRLTCAFVNGKGTRSSPSLQRRVQCVYTRTFKGSQRGLLMSTHAGQKEDRNIFLKGRCLAEIGGLSKTNSWKLNIQ